MIKKSSFGWCASFLAMSLVSLLLYSPVNALALSSDTSPTTVTAPGADVAGGSSADTTSQSSVQANLDATTTTTPGDGSTGQQQTGSSGDPTVPPTTQDNQTNTVNNNVNSNSQSGDATVAQSPVGGNATTGSSTASATLINTVGTSTGSDSTPFQTSTDNITGDQTGDVAVDPTTPPGQSGPSTVQPPDTSAQTTSSINNNVTLLADSGDATVQNNEVGGNATTGPATADANLINLIDSTINDQQSFLDIINIFGNLTGNIVLPQSLLDALSNPTTATGDGDGTSQVANNFLVNNNVTLLAQSGQAAVINNGNAGNAASGNATTNLQLYNLVDSQINGGNLLLVLVNVLGTWTGLLFNAPAGTNTATLGSGVQNNTASQVAPLNSTNTETINNDLYLSATSGNALDAFNGQGGNATSGNAMSSADIVNILGDQINLSGWLGILMINVFGTWNGSLVVAAPATTTTAGQGQSNDSSSLSPAGNNDPTTLIRDFRSLFTDGTNPTNSSQGSIVLASSVIPGHSATIFDAHAQTVSAKSNQPQQNDSSFSLTVIEVLLMALAVALLISERVITYRKQ